MTDFWLVVQVTILYSPQGLCTWHRPRDGLFGSSGSFSSFSSRVTSLVRTYPWPYLELGSSGAPGVCSSLPLPQQGTMGVPVTTFSALTAVSAGQGTSDRGPLQGTVSLGRAGMPLSHSPCHLPSLVPRLPESHSEHGCRNQPPGFWGPVHIWKHGVHIQKPRSFRTVIAEL